MIDSPTSEQPALSPSALWEQQGYYVARRVIPEALIDGLLHSYERDVVPFEGRLLRQNGQFETSRFTPHGGLVNTLLDPHSYGSQKYPELAAFRDGILNIVTAEPMLALLRSINQFQSYVATQSMFFDQTTTRAHQDFIYLDSLPHGYMIAAWIALERITDSSSRFFVHPGSHRMRVSVNRDDPAYFDELPRLVEAGGSKLHAPLLEKGDVLLWHSALVHGSLQGSDPALRRRSITVHYIPDAPDIGFGRIDGSVITKRSFEYSGVRCYENHLNLNGER